jgi:hypothetical protein
MEKICAKCGESKKMAEFRLDSVKKDGHSSRCKKCLNTQQMAKYIPKRSKQEIIFDGDVIRIVINDKKFGRVEALCDKEDYELVKDYRWNITMHGYIRTAIRIEGRQKILFLHRVILNCPEGFYSDHINRDRRDCRRKNLRICNKLENNRNLSKTKSKTSSRYKGVYWSSQAKRWVSSITVNYACLWIGSFKNEDDAAKAYNEAAIKHFGEFAALNEIRS